MRLTKEQIETITVYREGDTIGMRVAASTRSLGEPFPFEIQMSPEDARSIRDSLSQVLAEDD